MLRGSFYVFFGAWPDTATVKSAIEATNPDFAERFVPSICGFDPTDRLSVEHVSHLSDFGCGSVPWGAIGEVCTHASFCSEQTCVSRTRCR